MGQNKNDNKNRKEFKIPEDAAELAKLTFKKFKKHNDDGYYENKKELKRAYYSHMVDLLPDSIALIIKYGHLEAVQETKEKIYEKIIDPGFIKYLKKEIKSGVEFSNLELIPNIIYGILGEARKSLEEDNEEGTVSENFNVQDLKELSELILKKKLKKMDKEGIDEVVAFDVLSVIPNPTILRKSQYYHIRNMFMVLYEHAKTKEINFEKILKVLFKDDGEYIESVITFALLERKEKIGNFTDSQKKLFNDITEYCFKTLEGMKGDRIRDVLREYVNARKRDEAQNKDTNRRYFICSLPESDYPKIIKAVNKMISEDSSMKKYF